MTLWRELLAGTVACVLASATCAAEPAVEFTGVATAGNETRIALTDKATKQTQWVQTGGEFDGYEVARYDAKEAAVFLRKGTDEFRLALVPPKTSLDSRQNAPGSPALAGVSGLSGRSPATDAVANAVRSNLRTLVAAARQFQAERGAGTVTYADLVGPGKFIAELRPIAGENYSGLNFSRGVTSLSVTLANGITVGLDVPPPSTGGLAAGAGAPPPPLPAAAAVNPGPPTDATPANIKPAASVSSTMAAANGTTATPPPASTPPTSDALAPTGREPATAPSGYTIQNGDTWDKISIATGLPIDQLKRLNPNYAGGSLPPGQPVRIR